MKLDFIVFVLTIVMLLANTEAYKILGLFPHKGKSHFDVYAPLLKALAERGHDLTVIGHFPMKEPIRGYKDVLLDDSEGKFVNFFDINTFSGRRYEMYLAPLILAYFGYKACAEGLNTPSLKEFLRKNETYDLIIAEYFNGDCFLGFAHKYKVPVVGLSSCTMMPWLNDRFGNSDNPSYIPDNLMDFSDDMSFRERVENTLAVFLHKVLAYLLMDIPGNIIAKRHFGDDLPPLSEIVKNTSIMLSNTHPTLNLARPQVPNLIDVGGIHIGQVKQLPKVARCMLSSSISIFYSYIHMYMFYIKVRVCGQICIICLVNFMIQ